MFKNNVYNFSFEDWKGGINKSPYAGVDWMVNIEPHEKYGALTCGLKPTDVTDPLLASFARHAAFDEKNNDLYLGLDGGRLIKAGNAGAGAFTDISISADECHGLAVWKDHVLHSGETVLEVYDIDGTFFFNNWQTFTEGQRGLIDLPHQILVGRDDVVYITDGQYIASLQEQVGQNFDPNVPTTYTWNPTALDLPEGYVASCLSELGTFLIIGTYFDATLNRGNRADIFPWNRTAQSFQNPVRSKGNGVWQAIEHNSQLFALFDTKTQKLASSNLTFYQVIKEIEKVTNARLHPDAIDVINEEILMGIGSNSVTGENCGVYATKQVGEGYFTHLKNTLSPGTTGTEIGAVVATNDQNYVVTWENGTSYGYDFFSENRTDDYSSYVVTRYELVGRKGDEKQFKTLDVQLGKALASGHGVRVSFRPDTSDAWQTLATFEFTDYGAVSSMTKAINLSKVTGLQVKIELKGSGTTAPEFLNLSLS